MIDFTDPDYWYGILVGAGGTLAYQSLRRYALGGEKGNYRCRKFAKDAKGTFCIERKKNNRCYSRKKRDAKWKPVPCGGR